MYCTDGSSFFSVVHLFLHSTSILYSLSLSSSFSFTLRCPPVFIATFFFSLSSLLSMLGALKIPNLHSSTHTRAAERENSFPPSSTLQQEFVLYLAAKLLRSTRLKYSYTAAARAAATDFMLLLFGPRRPRSAHYITLTPLIIVRDLCVVQLAWY